MSKDASSSADAEELVASNQADPEVLVEEVEGFDYDSLVSKNVYTL